MAGRAAVSITVKSNRMSALQAFSLGGGWPRKAPRMPQDGRSPEGFIWGRGINTCYPTGIFRIRGEDKHQNRSTGLLERNSGKCSAQPTFRRNRDEFRLFCYMRLNRLGQERSFGLWRRSLRPPMSSNRLRSGRPRRAGNIVEYFVIRGERESVVFLVRAMSLFSQ